MFKRAIVFGASRGLGKAVVEHSRLQFEGLKDVVEVSRKSLPHALDLTKLDDQIKAGDLIESQGFDLVIYCAGGGPHGEFSSKEWKDHKWSLELNLYAPMFLIHRWLMARKESTTEGRFVVVGSRIAEQKPDPLAASYTAGKSGLCGFISSLQDELKESKSKVWLFSPGYMNTEMLPSTAKVRHDGSKLMSAEAAAQAMLRWLKNDGPWHRVLN